MDGKVVSDLNKSREVYNVHLNFKVEAKVIILESVNVWKNYKKRGPSRGSHLKGPVRTEAPTRRGMFTLNSRDLRMVFNDFIKDDFIPEGDGHVR